MPSHFHKKFRKGTVFATGRMSFIEPRTGLRMKRTNRRTPVPIGLYPCHIEEKITIKEVKGESIMEWKTKVTTKDGIVIKFPRHFRGYKLATEEEVEENEGLKEVWEQMEYVISDNDSDLESMASSSLRASPYLVHGVTPVVKSPYLLAPSEMQELSEQLRELGVEDASREVSISPSYHQLRVYEDAIPKTVFQTIYRHFESTVMPFGLTNAPAVFMDLMNRVCKPYLGRLVIVFIDDIFAYSKSKEEHEVHLKLVLDLLKKEKLLLPTFIVNFFMIFEPSYFPNWEKSEVEMDDLPVGLANAAESVRDTIGFEYCLASSNGWTKSSILWAEIGESSLTGLELVQEKTDKVVLVNEKPKAARDHQKSDVDYRRKPLEFEVGNRVLLTVTPWKGVVRFGKKG
ncbi:putative reverse transcriptase domain-containing protein [Tanacetum coccineum]